MGQVGRVRTNVLKGSLRHLFCSMFGLARLLRVLWMARVLTWCSEMAKNVNEVLGMKCLALVKCYTAISGFCIWRIFSTANCETKSFRYCFNDQWCLNPSKLNPTNAVFLIPNFTNVDKENRECFQSTPVWCSPTCPRHQKHLYDQSLMVCVGEQLSQGTEILNCVL